MTSPSATLAPETVTYPELSIADRCDRCGAQAFFIAISNTTSNDLMFCAHHGRANEPGLAAKGFTVIDQSERINKKPSPSANHQG